MADFSQFLCFGPCYRALSINLAIDAVVNPVVRLSQSQPAANAR
jgi:hypothetical protein